MNSTDIILILFFSIFAIILIAFLILFTMKTKLQFKATLVKGHRELWMFYQKNEDELKEIFNKESKNKLTPIQNRFLVMLFNHMELSYKMNEYQLLPCTNYKQDFKHLMSNNLIKTFWEQNKIYRNKGFKKLIDNSL